MGNTTVKSESKQFSKSDVVVGKPVADIVSKMTSSEMMDKFNAIIQKKKEKFYSANLKPKDFTKMREQVQVGVL
jgi:hypothetical protein